MPSERRAVIDVGTNSVKLLVAEVDGETIEPLVEQAAQTRLGRGFYAARRLQPEAIRQTAAAVAGFAALARQWHPGRLRVIATSAARDAGNAGELVAAIRAAAGLLTEIIPGDQEAEWAYRGVATDPALGPGPLLLCEVGGGSTQMILGDRGHHRFRQSLPLGGVRLLEQHPPADRPTAADLAECRACLGAFLEREVSPLLTKALAGLASAKPRLVATGGTSTILARMEHRLNGFDRAVLEGTRLSRARLTELVSRLWSLSLAERKRLPGLPPSRADVILTGTAIYEAVMARFAFDELRVSTRGLRFGALLDGP